MQAVCPETVTAPAPALFDDGLLVIDFETAYDKKYSLRKLTTPEYVADKRFKCLGVALRYPDGRLAFRVDVAAAFAELQVQYGPNFERVTVVCHNAAFDCFILNYIYGIRPPRILCTQLFAYHVWGRKGKNDRGRLEGEAATLEALATRYNIGVKGDISDFCGLWDLDGPALAAMAQYAKQDANLEALLVPKLAADITNIKSELALITHTIGLYTTRCVHIDLAGLRKLRDEVRSTTQAFLDKAGVTLDGVGKNKQFIPLLEAALAATGRKIPLKLGKKGEIPATAKQDPAMLALCEDDDPIVAALAMARVKRKSQDQLLARLDTIERVAQAMHVLEKVPGDFAAAAIGRVPVHLIYYGAHTGRWAGGGKLNFQNLGKTGFGLRIRNLILPAPGCKFVVGDLAAIEARVLAWLAGQPELLEAYALDKDVYSEFAATTFQTLVRKPRADDPPELSKRLKAFRGVGKIAILGLGYGMGALKHINQLRSAPETAPLFDEGVLYPLKCKEVVKAYRARYYQIPDLWAGLETAFRVAIRGETVTGDRVSLSNASGCVLVHLPSGRALRSPRARLEAGAKVIKYLDDAGNEDEFTAEGEQVVYGNGTSLYGGKLVENIVQAISRDILAEALLRLEANGRKAVLHAHDEIVLEVPDAETGAAAKELMQELTRVPTWAPGLPLGAEVGVMEHYDK